MGRFRIIYIRAMALSVVRKSVQCRMTLIPCPLAANPLDSRENEPNTEVKLLRSFFATGSVVNSARAQAKCFPRMQSFC